MTDKKSPFIREELTKYGGLENESDLLEICPVEFKKSHNPWSMYADDMYCGDPNISNWKWRSDDEKVRERQWACLQAVFRSPDLNQNDKNALAAWMLSEMLSEIPKYLPLNKGR